jgi:hypothetical protein
MYLDRPTAQSLAFSLMNQGARHRIFPVTRRRGIGTLLMFVVRNIFSKPDYRRDVFAELVEQGQLDPSILSAGDPLGFHVSEGAAESITDAAYRYARHEQGADVMLAKLDFALGPADIHQIKLGRSESTR